MTNNEKRTIIAKACGWKLKWQNVGGASLLDAKPTGHSWEVWIAPAEWLQAEARKQALRSPGLHFYSDIHPPNYTGDLNACLEMELGLSKEDHYYYSNLLCKLTNPDRAEMACVINPEAGMYPSLVSATAEQRADTFIAYFKLGLK